MNSDSASGVVRKVRQVLGRVQPDGLRMVRRYRAALVSEGPEFHHLKEIIEPNSVVIDVGAHMGVYTYLLARLVGKEGLVIAIEPIPELARRLRRGVAQLRLEVQVESCVLSDQNNDAILHIPVKGGTAIQSRASITAHGFNDYTAIRVAARRLDDLANSLAERVSFIKIDVEGHELAVLQGATHVLEAHRPTLLIEIEQRHAPTSIAETFQFLEGFGYEGTFVDEGGARRSISSFDLCVHQRIENAEGRGFYVNNFLFTHSSLTLPLQRDIADKS